MSKSIPNTNYEIPTSTDSGDVIFTILEDFMTRMAQHKHDGFETGDSNNITANIDKQPLVEDGIVPAGWLDGGEGVYYHDVPYGSSGVTIGGNTLKFYYKIESTDLNWTEFYPTYEETPGADGIRVFCNDTSIEELKIWGV